MSIEYYLLKKKKDAAENRPKSAEADTISYGVREKEVGGERSRRVKGKNLSGGESERARRGSAAEKNSLLRLVEIYTDGGCDPNPGLGGWGAIIRDVETGREKELCGGEAKTTNNRMEITAVLRALEELKSSCRVVVTTDSQYLARAFSDGWLDKWKRNGWKTAGKQPVKNRDLWERLDALTRRHEVTWFWTRGHVGHPENERCDQLAGEGRKQVLGRRA